MRRLKLQADRAGTMEGPDFSVSFYFCATALFFLSPRCVSLKQPQIVWSGEEKPIWDAEAVDMRTQKQFLEMLAQAGLK